MNNEKLEEVLNANPQLSEEQRAYLEKPDSLTNIFQPINLVELGWTVAMTYARANLGVKTWKKK